MESDYIPLADQAIMIDELGRQGHINCQPQDAVELIGRGIFNHWNTHTRPHLSRENYPMDTAFTSYIANETHYHLVRRKFRWDESAKLFEGVSDSDYRKAREQVIRALAVNGAGYVRMGIGHTVKLVSLEAYIRQPVSS